jgi:hypothetical protein
MPCAKQHLLEPGCFAGEPGTHRREVVAFTATTAGAAASALAGSPRVCSSITRSSMEATKVRRPP